MNRYDDEKFEYALKFTYKHLMTFLKDKNEPDVLPAIPDIYFRYVDTCAPDEPPFTLKRMCNDNEVCGILEAYGLDAEKFWYVADFIYFITKMNCWEQKPSYTMYDQCMALLEHMDGADEITVRAKGQKHNLVLHGKYSIGMLKRYLGILVERKGDDMHFAEILHTSIPEEKSDSECIWYADILFDMLFKTLELPEIRGGAARVTASKKYLVARLMHLMGFAKTSDFDNKSLNGVVRKYKDKKFTITLDI